MQLNENNAENDATNECCNSGCNNCVLDIRQCELEKQRRQLKSNVCKRINVFNSGSYATFQVKSIVALTANVRRFSFQYNIDGICHGNVANGSDKQQQPHRTSASIGLASPSHYLHIPPTFYLLLRAPIGGGESELLGARDRHDKNTADHYISRPYTPCAYNHEALTFDILVKLQATGLMSEYFQALQIDQCCEWKGCFGSFTYTPNKYKYLICISQGVAIAPIHHLIASILADDTDDTIVYSLACYRNIENILLRDEHSQFRQYWNFHSYIYLSEAQCNCNAATAKASGTNDAGRRDAQQQQKRGKCCQCIEQQQKFNENIRNYRLDSRELIDLYQKLSTSSICTVFCGMVKLEAVIKQSLSVIGDRTITDNYFNLE